MAQQIINIGAVPGDKTGDTLRTGGQKINANFAELYTKVANTFIPAQTGNANRALYTDGATITWRDVNRLTNQNFTVTLDEFGALTVPTHSQYTKGYITSINPIIDLVSTQAAGGAGVNWFIPSGTTTSASPNDAISSKAYANNSGVWLKTITATNTYNVNLNTSGQLTLPSYTLPNTVGTAGQFLTWPGSGTTLVWSSEPAASAGTLTGTTLNATVVSSSLTSVGTLTGLTISTLSGVLKATSGVVSAASAGTDYIAPYGSTTAKYVLAAPNASAGTPSFRLLVASDLPSTISPTTVLVGSQANLTRFPNAQVVVSTVSAGIQQNEAGAIGIIGEVVGASSNRNAGVYGVGYTSGTFNGQGVVGESHVSATGDSAPAVGVRGYSNDTHAGGLNVGLYGDATNGSANYALYLNSGGIYTAGALTWTLNGNLTFSGTYTVGTVNFSRSGLLVEPANYIVVGSTATYALSTTVTDNVLVVSTTALTATLTFPSSGLVDGQRLKFTVTTNTVTLALTAGPTLVGTFAGSVTAPTTFTYVYRTSNTTWYRV
jgi:hypothetical protein